ncbi:MAG: radical SAM protein, partial [Candidatus Omnitrophica bacterium]|nr:radical SAM protein [Candidatus Omnitrophota bacterium]
KQGATGSLAELVDVGCFYLGFTGGEPFIREDIMEILWYAKMKGFQIIIYTNGSLINRERARELGHLKPNKVDITIPAMSKEIFEIVTGVKGARDKVFTAIELLYKNGVNLGFKTCVLKDNEKEINQIENFAKSLGALHRLDDKLSRRLDGSDEPYGYRGLYRENYLIPKHLESGEKGECDFSMSHHKINVRKKNLFYCGVGINQAAITPLGEIKMCVMIDYPKYKIRVNQAGREANSKNEDSSLIMVWNQLKKLVRKIELENNYQCDSCKLREFCNWCPAKSWLAKRDFTSCVDILGYNNCASKGKNMVETSRSGFKSS